MAMLLPVGMHTKVQDGDTTSRSTFVFTSWVSGMLRSPVFAGALAMEEMAARMKMWILVRRTCCVLVGMDVRNCKRLRWEGVRRVGM